MAPLEREINVNVLREYAVLATRETKRLQTLVDNLNKLLSEANQTWLKDEAAGQDLSDQLSRLQKKFYGFGRESLNSENGMRPIGHAGQQLKLHGERTYDENPNVEINPPSEEKAVDSKAAPLVIEYPMSDTNLKQETQTREPEASASGVGANAWSEMKSFSEDSVEITITEVTYTKVIHRRKKYRMKDEYNTSGKEVIITAPGPVKLKPQSKYSIDFALAVVSDKYEYHLPLERQRRKMEACGLEIDVKTLYTLCQSTSEHMEALALRIKQEILNDFCAVHVDESPWLIISEKHKGQMWAVSNRVGSYYQFEPSRAGAVAEEMLEGFTGSVITDALPAYNRLKLIEGMRKGLCWAHVRREFYERMDDFPAAEIMVRLIDDLFAIEAKAKSFDELRVLRRTESLEKIREMQSWLIDETPRYLPGDGIKKAINYCASHWTDLTTFLKDLSLPLSNNDAERALRHVVLGRKNFAGSKTIDGADVAATLYTIIESAKKAGLQPKAYMKYVIEERWYGREPKTPSQLALEKFGPNKRVTFPEKTDWRI
jgi:transposase